MSSDEKRSSHALTARRQYPEATSDALWEVVESLAPGLVCRRPYQHLGGPDVDCLDFPEGWRGRAWCKPCSVRKRLRESHQASLDLRVWQPPRLDLADPKLTTRERVLCAVQSCCDTQKHGTTDQQRAARDVFYRVLDEHEFNIALHQVERSP